MKLSPTFLPKLSSLGLEILVILVISFIVGFGLLKLIVGFQKAWKHNQKIKMWLYLSGGAFLLYMFFIGTR